MLALHNTLNPRTAGACIFYESYFEGILYKFLPYGGQGFWALPQDRNTRRGLVSKMPHCPFPMWPKPCLEEIMRKVLLFLSLLLFSSYSLACISVKQVDKDVAKVYPDARVVYETKSVPVLDMLLPNTAFEKADYVRAYLISQPGVPENQVVMLIFFDKGCAVDDKGEQVTQAEQLVVSLFPVSVAQQMLKQLREIEKRTNI